MNQFQILYRRSTCSLIGKILYYNLCVFIMLCKMHHCIKNCTVTLFFYKHHSYSHFLVICNGEDTAYGGDMVFSPAVKTPMSHIAVNGSIIWLQIWFQLPAIKTLGGSDGTILFGLQLTYMENLDQVPNPSFGFSPILIFSVS